VVAEAAIQSEDLADSFISHSILTVATAVFQTLVDDVEHSSLEMWLDNGFQSNDVHSNEHVIREAHQLATGLASSKALVGTAAQGLRKGSPDAERWYREWATVYLQASCHSLVFSKETLVSERWDRLCVRLTLMKSEGDYFTLVFGTHGTNAPAG